jgi:hypothetical protein
MNKYFFEITLILYVVLLLFSCGDSEEPDLPQAVWSLNVSAYLKNSHLFTVKCAAFLTKNNTSFSENAFIVSNVTDSGLFPGFQLMINADNVPVNNGDTIDLIMWEDANSNGICNAGESWQYTEPQSGCPVFGNAVKCCFFYSSDDLPELGIVHGWNTDRGNLDSEPIEALQGTALIQDWSLTWKN